MKRYLVSAFTFLTALQLVKLSNLVHDFRSKQFLRILLTLQKYSFSA